MISAKEARDLIKSEEHIEKILNKVEEEIILKNRMAEFIGRLSTQIIIEDKARLDLEYNEILNKLRALG